MYILIHTRFIPYCYIQNILRVSSSYQVLYTGDLKKAKVWVQPDTPSMLIRELDNLTGFRCIPLSEAYIMNVMDS